jgi:hypothetical protein
VLLEHAGRLGQVGFAACHFLRVGILARNEFLPDVLPREHADSRAEMLAGPEHPAVHVGTSLAVLRPHGLAGRALGQVLHDRARFPQDKVAVDEHRDLAVGIDFFEAAAIVLAGQVDLDEVELDAEVVGGQQHAAGVGRVRVVVELHCCLLVGGRYDNVKARP